jgi:hypothetical protein
MRDWVFINWAVQIFNSENQLYMKIIDEIKGQLRDENMSTFLNTSFVAIYKRVNFDLYQ